MPLTIAIVGAGHNGLVAAFYLARAGFKPIVLERRSVAGGAAVTEEIAPGHRVPSLAHTAGSLRPSVLRDMQVARRVEFLRPDPALVSLSADGRPLVISPDRARTADALHAHSAADAETYLRFCDTLDRVGAFLAPILDRTPPSLDGPAPGEVWELLKTGRRFRKLATQDAFRLLRWLPMAVADLVHEWFAGELLQAAVATRGIFGNAAGPWSAGTGAAMLLNWALDPAPGGSTVMVKGGPGALTRALAEAAREAGATIRLDAPVTRVVVKEGRAAGVLLADGSELAADAVVSSADPRRTFLDLVDPGELEPTFLQRVRNYRMAGTAAKVNFTLSGLPSFAGVANPSDLAGRIMIGPSIDYLEAAFDASKYGRASEQPYLDITIPSLLDPSLCPPGRHVMSVYVQYAPYRVAADGGWDAARDQLGDIVLRTLERYSPGIWNRIEHRQILTPLELEETYGLSRGHILHGDHALDQLLMMRPVLGWARYGSPIERLFLCGAGTHPGGGLTGAPGRNAAREIARALRR